MTKFGLEMTRSKCNPPTRDNPVYQARWPAEPARDSKRAG